MAISTVDLLDMLFNIEPVGFSLYVNMDVAISQLYLDQHDIDNAYDTINILSMAGGIYADLIVLLADLCRLDNPQEFDAMMNYGKQALNEFLYFGVFFTYYYEGDEHYSAIPPYVISDNEIIFDGVDQEYANVHVYSTINGDVCKCSDNYITVITQNSFYHSYTGLEMLGDSFIHVSKGAQIGTLHYRYQEEQPLMEYKISVHIEGYCNDEYYSSVYYVDPIQYFSDTPLYDMRWINADDLRDNVYPTGDDDLRVWDNNRNGFSLYTISDYLTEIISRSADEYNGVVDEYDIQIYINKILASAIIPLKARYMDSEWKDEDSYIKKTMGISDYNIFYTYYMSKWNEYLIPSIESLPAESYGIIGDEYANRWDWLLLNSAPEQKGILKLGTYENGSVALSTTKLTSNITDEDLLFYNKRLASDYCPYGGGPDSDC